MHSGQPIISQTWKSLILLSKDSKKSLREFESFSEFVFIFFSLFRHVLFCFVGCLDRLAIKSAKPAQGIFTPCVAFRVAGMPIKHINSKYIFA